MPIWAYNLLLVEATEKLQTYLESWIIQDFKNVHDLAMALVVKNLQASKFHSGFLIYQVETLPISPDMQFTHTGGSFLSIRFRAFASDKLDWRHQRQRRERQQRLRPGPPPGHRRHLESVCGHQDGRLPGRRFRRELVQRDQRPLPELSRRRFVGRLVPKSPETLKSRIRESDPAAVTSARAFPSGLSSKAYAFFSSGNS